MLLANGRHFPRTVRVEPIYRVRRPQIPLSKDENTTRSSSNIPASGFLSNELQFGSLFAPVGIELSQGPQGRNMRRERDYRDLASVFLHLATAPPRMAENLEQGCPNAQTTKDTESWSEQS